MLRKPFHAEINRAKRPCGPHETASRAKCSPRAGQPWFNGYENNCSIYLSFIVLKNFFANACVKKIVPHQPKASPHVTEDIYAFPYTIQSESLLTNEEKEKRFHYANWFAEKLEEDTNFPVKFHMTDECHAHLSAVVNQQNFWFLGTEIRTDSSS